MLLRPSSNASPRKQWLPRRRHLFYLLLVFVGLLFVGVVLRYRPSTVPQFVDLLRLPSTVYIPNISCDRCNHFDMRCISEPMINCSVIDDSNESGIFLMILVMSAVDNFERRRAIRRTWGGTTTHRRHRVRTYFMCGRSSTDSTAADVVRLRKEIADFGDVVQLDIVDSYTWLTNKTVAALRWATKRRCPDVQFILKTDDDSFNVPGRFIDRLVDVDHLTTGNSRPFVGGQCSSGDEPVRAVGKKWFVSELSYPGWYYPLHAKGRAYLLSSLAARLIVEASANVVFNAMEDVFVTGLCRVRVGIACTNVAGIRRDNEAITDCDVATSSVYNVHYVTDDVKMDRLWNVVLNGSAECLSTVRSGATTDLSTCCSIVFVRLLVLLPLFDFICCSRYH